MKGVIKMDAYFEKMYFVFFENKQGEADVIAIHRNTINDVSKLVDDCNYFLD